VNRENPETNPPGEARKKNLKAEEEKAQPQMDAERNVSNLSSKSVFL